MQNTVEPESKSEFSQQTLLLYIGLAAIIYLAEELGRLAGLSGIGLQISPIWPAAGIALAALLLWGRSVWPGVFLGFLIYNCLHLAISYPSIWQGIAIGIGMSLASLAQAFLATYLIRRFSNIVFYQSLRNTLLFFIIAIAACLIAPSLYTAILYASGNISWENMAFGWITFWIGDTLGMLLITPLIISFTLSPPIKYQKKYVIEASFLFILLGLASLGIFLSTYPMGSWLLPFLLWATFRFNIRGLTVALVLISSIAVLATGLGYGPYYSLEVHQSLFYLATFIGIITATMLILTGILNENNEAAKFLQEYNLSLENAVHTRTHQLDEAKDEIIVREKLTSLAVLAAGISHEIKNPLLHIDDLVKTAQDCVANVQEVCDTNKNLFSSDVSDHVDANFKNLRECLIEIEDYDKRAQEIVNIIFQRSRREAEHETGFRTVNIHNILNGCCNKARREFEQKTPYSLYIIKNYDFTIGPIEVITLDLSRALTTIIDNSIYALKQKTAHYLEFFEPTLSIQTVNREHDIEISIEDNGIGMPEAVLKRLFQPFFSTKPLGEGTGLGLALAYDIIVHGHHGSLSALSEKDNFTKIVIFLPKGHATDARE